MFSIHLGSGFLGTVETAGKLDKSSLVRKSKVCYTDFIRINRERSGFEHGSFNVRKAAAY